MLINGCSSKSGLRNKRLKRPLLQQAAAVKLYSRATRLRPVLCFSSCQHGNPPFNMFLNQIKGHGILRQVIACVGIQLQFDVAAVGVHGLL